MAIPKKMYIITLLLLLAFFWGNCREEKKDNSLALAAFAFAMFGEPLVNKSCAGSTETYSWGKFTDQCNGTVKFEGVAGTFGGQVYTAQNLIFMKCSQGQVWNSENNDCTGTGNTGDNFGASSIYEYCNAADNSCNGGTNFGVLDGGGTSTAYTTCNTLSFAGKMSGSWRVPTKNELKALIHCTDKVIPDDRNDCGTGNYTSPSINHLFSNTVINPYWSSSSASGGRAWEVDFGTGRINDGSDKFSVYSIRCVSGL